MGSEVHPKNIKSEWVIEITQEPLSKEWYTLNNRLLRAYRMYYQERLPGNVSPLRVQFVDFQDCGDEEKARISKISKERNSKERFAMIVLLLFFAYCLIAKVAPQSMLGNKL